MRRLETLIDEVRLLWNALVTITDALHAREGLTASPRAILEFLDRQGPATVPAMARARGVSRQHVQAIVDRLAAGGLVAHVANPAHRRSPLARLTASGAATIGRVRRREAGILDRLAAGLSGNDIDSCVATIRTVRASLAKEASKR
jgi:DNA-binding MarR family transcriptional regulator